MNIDTIFDNTIHEIQSQLEQRTNQQNSSSLTKFVEELKEFREGEVIFDYPDWLDRLRIQANILSSQVNGALIAIVADNVTSLIEDLSYGGTEAHHAEEAKRIGADALLIATPPYAYPTSREIALHALAIERAANLPVMLYNYPGRMSVSMDEEVLDRLGRNPNFCGIKESSGDIDRLHLLARDYTHIGLACGMDDQALEYFAWGAKAWVCAGSNFAPEAHIALYQTCVIEGDFNKGRRIMSAMLPLMRVLEQGGKFVQSIKHGLTLRGIECGPPRKPLQPLNKDDKRELAEVIKTMNTILSWFISIFICFNI